MGNVVAVVLTYGTCWLSSSFTLMIPQLIINNTDVFSEDGGGMSASAHKNLGAEVRGQMFCHTREVIFL